MPYRYLAIAGARHAEGETMRHVRRMLRESGLLPCLCTDALDVFASEETPTLSVPGGNLLIGRVFRKDGTPLQSAEDFPALLDQRQLRQFLLDHCWGEYVLMQSGSDDDADVIITRDPSAGVPCTYSSGMRPWFATSDISLAVHHKLYRKQIDWDSITQCLLYPHQMTQQTALAGIFELLPGCLLRVKDTDTTLEQVWSPWDFVTPGQRHDDPDEATAHIRDSVMTATRAWAEMDRSVLLELSGGLDSSVLAACLRDTAADVSCCTLITPVPGADERQYANLVTDDLGVTLQVEELSFELARFDAPPPTWSVAPRINILQHALNETMIEIGNQSGAASCFSGGGGDTVFCYLSNAAPAADAFRERGISAGANAVRDLSHLHQCTLWKAARLTINKLFRPPTPPHVADRTLLSEGTGTVPHAWHPWFDAPAGALPGDRRRIQLLAGAQIYRHGMWRGPMRDLRMPLLSQPVVEACLKAPSWMWIAGGRNRSLARAAFSNELPQAVRDRRSKGDFAQYLGAAWRRNKHRMREFLLEGELQARGLLASDDLREFFQRHRPARDQSFFRVFDLCMIENWVRHQR